jgi:predicted RNA polymerase sigma factor
MALDTEELTEAVPRLYRYALSLSRNHDLAEDLVQDTVVRALERHLGGCPTCPPLFAGLVGVRDGLERLRDPDTVIAPALAQRLLALRAGA